MIHLRGPRGTILKTFDSVKEASSALGLPISDVIHYAINRIVATDGTYLSTEKQSELIKRAVKEYMAYRTSVPKLMAKYPVDYARLRKAIVKCKDDELSSKAALDWIRSGDSVQSVADRHGIALWKLNKAINKKLANRRMPHVEV